MDIEQLDSVENSGGDLAAYRKLKVLLVEDDDSTRLVVGALLQNCGYQVVPAANGLRAWELLEDPGRKLDLVLTNVTMPGLSGVGLLSRITNHSRLRRIPVVMMSSHDSTRIVFKCLVKGAVDFLVKPVRKNELKNMWQHSWRRYQSMNRSGKGSETHKDLREELELGECLDGQGASIPGGSDSTQSSRTTDADNAEVRMKFNRREVGEDMCGPAEDNNDTSETCSPVEDLIGRVAFEENQDREPALEETDSERRGSNNPRHESSSDPNSGSRLELSLRTSGLEQQSCPSERNNNGCFGQSGPSAFSRYTTGTSREKENAGQQAQQEQEKNAEKQVRQEENARDGYANLRPAIALQYATVMSYDNGIPPTAYFYPQLPLAPWQHAFSPPRDTDAGAGQAHHHHHHHVYHHHHNRVKNGCGANAEQLGLRSASASGSGNLVSNSGSSPSVPLKATAAAHVEADKIAMREAALNKFRQKRKERCFEKKVRYQSRKRLAESRPRVRGQFVSQANFDTICNK